MPFASVLCLHLFDPPQPFAPPPANYRRFYTNSTRYQKLKPNMGRHNGRNKAIVWF